MASEEGLVVNLPQGIDQTGKWKTVPVDLSRARASELLFLVKEYRLRASARNKSGYTQTLLDFSRNEKKWDERRVLSLQTPHKGPRTPRKNKSRSFTTPESPSPVERGGIRKIRGLPALPRNPGIAGTLEVDVDQRGVHSGEQLLSWASRLVDHEEKTQLEQGSSASAVSPSCSLRSSPSEGMVHGNGSAQQSLGGPSPPLAPHVIAELMKAASLINAALGPPQMPAMVGDNPPISLISSDHPVQLSHQPLVPPSAVQSRHEVPNQRSPSQNLKELTVSLYMRDRTVSFSENDIPPPPPLPWKTSVETINALWDDDPSTWNLASPLIIKGISIPLVYWPTLYKNRRSGHWDSLKKRWSEWKYLVLEYRRLKPDRFWSAHSTDGLRHPISRILTALRLQRAHADTVLADKIKDNLKDKFNDVYSYSNGRRTMKTPGGVARRYRRTQDAIKQGVEGNGA